MPKTPVDEAPAGPAMDAAVAEVLGLKVQWRASTCAPVRPGWYAVYLAGIYANEYDGWAEHEDWRPVLPYSADIAAAWRLWGELIKEDPEGWAIYSREENCVQIEYYSEEWAREYGMGDLMAYGLAPLAISRAFLKANGVEHIVVPE